MVGFGAGAGAAAAAAAAKSSEGGRDEITRASQPDISSSGGGGWVSEEDSGIGGCYLLGFEEGPRGGKLFTRDTYNFLCVVHLRYVHDSAVVAKIERFAFPWIGY